MSTSLAFQPGDRCGQYVIVDLLSAGGIGEVYRAEQRSVGRQVAIKCLQFRHANREDLQKRMAMEGQALGRIGHSNMVTVFDAGCTDHGVIWIAMELLVGETLREVLQQRERLEVIEAVSCAVDVAEAVGAAHREGIIHRDIKPENVFVTEHGTVKVLDLGTAKLQGWGDLKTTEKGRILGTPAYMSPEQIRCIRLDERSDIYALGVMLYEMLAGHPFAHRVNLADHYELARMHLFGEVRPLPSVVEGVSERLDSVVRRAMTKEPSQRYETMAAFANDLRLAAGLMTPTIRGSVRPDPARTSSSQLGPHGTVRIPKDSVPAPAPAPPSLRTERCGEPDIPSTGASSSTVGTTATGTRSSMAAWVVAILAGGLMGGVIGGAVLLWPAGSDATAPTQASATSTSTGMASGAAFSPEASGAPVATGSSSSPPVDSWPSTEPVVRTPPAKEKDKETDTPEDRKPPPAVPTTRRPPTTAATRSQPSSSDERNMPSSGL